MNWTRLEGCNQGGGRDMDGLVSVSLNSSGDGTKRTVRIGIPVEAMKAIRYVIGDRIDILYDREERLICVSRVTQGGKCTLSPQGGKIATYRGESRPATLQFTGNEKLNGMMPAKLQRCQWRPDSSGLVIQLKEEV